MVGNNSIVIFLLLLLVACSSSERSTGSPDEMYRPQIHFSADTGGISGPVAFPPPDEQNKDPKVFWYEEGKQWVMTRSTDNRMGIYTSPNQEEWTYQSTFGKGIGSDEDMWEAVEIFQLTVEDENESKWICLVNIEFAFSDEWATGYFTGHFDGVRFTPDRTEPFWLDHGKDFYAGRTSELPDGRRILIGWMGNWAYADKLPVTQWQGALSLPRVLSLEKVNGNYLLVSTPVKELELLREEQVVLANIELAQNIEQEGLVDITSNIPFSLLPSEVILRIKLEEQLGRLNFAEKFGIRFSNKEGEYIAAGYDYFSRRFYIDRRNATGAVISETFAGIHILPFDIEGFQELDMRIILDKSSIELFAMGGKAVMTDTFFPSSEFDRVTLYAENGKVSLANVSVTRLNPHK